MIKQYKYSDSDSDDSDSDLEDFINKFKAKSNTDISNININTQPNDVNNQDTQKDISPINKLTQQNSMNKSLVKENSNNSNSQNSQFHIPSRTVNKNIWKVESDNSDEDEDQSKSNNNFKNKVQNMNSQSSNNFSKGQQKEQMQNMDSNTKMYYENQPQTKNNIVREVAFPGLEIPHESDLLVSKKKYEEVDNFFQELLKRGSKKNILFLTGSSGVGKKTLIASLVEKKLQHQMVYFNRMKKLQQSAEKEEFNNYDEQSSLLNNNSYLENPVELLLYAFNRSLSSTLYKNEVIVLQELPESAKASEIKRIGEFINNRYMKAKNKKNPIIFILNSSIYSPFLITKIFKDQCPEFYNQCIQEINLPNPTDNQIKQFVERQMYKIPRFKQLSKYQISSITSDIVQTANGDISNVLNQLKMISVSRIPPSEEMQIKVKGKKGQKNDYVSQADKQDISENNSYQQKSKKDNEFTIFHTLGKFLYNKRIMRNTKGEARQMTKEELLTGKADFYFNPMTMVRQISFGQDFFRNALQQNYLDFYGDIEDVVRQANVFAMGDIFEKENFNEKNEVMKEENDFLCSQIIGEGLMFNNFNGKGVVKKYGGIVKSQLSDFHREKKYRQYSLRRQFPYINLAKYVLEYNHHLTINPQILAQDLVKSKGTWHQQKIIHESTLNLNSIGFDSIGEDTYYPTNQKNMVLFKKDINQKEIIEDDIEEC